VLAGLFMCVYVIVQMSSLIGSFGGLLGSKLLITFVGTGCIGVASD
jgi:hypothetical protein